MSENLRFTKDQAFLEMAGNLARMGTCLHKNYGVLIVRNSDQGIVGNGYSGVPSGMPHCVSCAGTDCNTCRGVHAISNALVRGNVSKGSEDTYTLYLYGIDAETHERIEAEPCNSCMNLLLNTAVSTVKSYNAAGEIVSLSLESVKMKRKAEIFSSSATTDFSALMNPDNLIMG